MDREEFVKSLYDDPEELKEIYATQKENEVKILNEIAMILLTYTIVDSILKLTNKEKSDNYSKLSTLILDMFGKEIKSTTKGITDILSDVTKKSFESYGILTHKDEMLKIINEHYKGKHFSDRVWDNENQVSKMMHKEIKDFLDGKVNANQIKSHIEKQFKADKYNVKRLVDSEIGNIESKITEKYFKDYGIKRVKYNATLCNTCDKCMIYHGKVFNVDDNSRPSLPQHAQCHCFYVQVEDVKKEHDKVKEAAKKDQNSRQNKELDYMSNRFVPEFGEEKEFKLGNISINEKKVSNSKFNMWTDLEATKKNKAIRLYEKKIEKIQDRLPEWFDMPRVSIIDFKKNGFPKDAIGGYQRKVNTVFINNKYDTDSKIIKYLKNKEGYFANIESNSPLIHELGHKYHYDLVELFANKKGLSYNNAKEIFDADIEKYILSQSLMPRKFISNQLSCYAADEFDGPNRVNEIIAEYFTIKEFKDKSELVKFIDKYIKRGDES